MQKFLAMFFGGIDSLKYQNLSKATEADRKAHTEAWASWAAGLAKKGALETGYPLDAPMRRIDASGIETAALSEDSAGGFMVLQAESTEEAAELLKDCPIIRNGGSIVLRLCGRMTQDGRGGPAT